MSVKKIIPQILQYVKPADYLSLTIDKRRLREYMGTLDNRFLPAIDKALAISIGVSGHSQSTSLFVHERCTLHDDSIQKKD